MNAFVQVGNVREVKGPEAHKEDLLSIVAAIDTDNEMMTKVFSLSPSLFPNR